MIYLNQIHTGLVPKVICQWIYLQWEVLTATMTMHSCHQDQCFYFNKAEGHIAQKNDKKWLGWKFPGGPMVRTLCFHFLVVVVTKSMSDSWDPMDCSLPGSSVHRIFQARILEWVTISFSRASSWTRDWIRVSHIPHRFFTNWTTREAFISWGFISKVQSLVGN